VTAAIYFMIILEASVFPAPLSPIKYNKQKSLIQIEKKPWIIKNTQA